MAAQTHYKHSRSQYWLLVTRSWSGGVRCGPVGSGGVFSHTQNSPLLNCDELIDTRVFRKIKVEIAMQ